MKTKKIIALILILFAAGSLIYSFAFKDKTVPPEQETFKTTAQGDKTIVYYFYTDVRCQSCINIEAYTKEAVEKFDSKMVEFCGINTDKKENEHFISDYQLYTKAVVLSKIRDGKETEWQNLEKIWELAASKEKFIAYIAENIQLISGGSNE